MKEYAVILVIIVLIIVFASILPLYAQIEWQKLSEGSNRVNTVLLDSKTNDIIYAGTENAVLKTINCGLNWRVVLSLKTNKGGVNSLFQDKIFKDRIYAASSDGLFCSLNNGKSWKKIFKGKSAMENECTVVIALGDNIYLGSGKGLFISSDGGKNWKKEEGEIGNHRIVSMAISSAKPGQNYCLSVAGLFKFNEEHKTWERIFTAWAKEKEAQDSDVPEYSENNAEYSNLKHVAFDPYDPKHIYLGTTKGIYRSIDAGLNWKAVTDFGLLDHEVKFMAFFNDAGICLLTKTGLYSFNGERWEELTIRLMAQDFSSLAFDQEGNAYLACEKGLFKEGLNLKKRTIINTELSSYYMGEPSIEDLQKAAIQYAEVDIEKIKDWRKRAAKKAWLPQINCGINRDVTDLWHWEGGSTTKNDDDILRKGKDSIEWDVTLNWDLGELIWNQDQTTIDSRSKLMVELRDDILDAVTKLYFERIRIKVELGNIPIEERSKNLELKLRLRELTASLDAMTGGYFSRNIKDRFML